MHVETQRSVSSGMDSGPIRSEAKASQIARVPTKMRLSPIVVRFSVFGTVPSLKNQKKIGKGRMFNDPQITAYQQTFALQVPAKYRDIQIGSQSDPLEATVVLFHDSWRRDADAEIIFDCLQTAGVVSNDRWIRRKFIYAERIDAANPRCNITVSYI